MVVSFKVTVPFVDPVTALVNVARGTLAAGRAKVPAPPLPPVTFAVAVTLPSTEVDEAVGVAVPPLPPAPPASRPAPPLPPVAVAVEVAVLVAVAVALAVEVALPPAPPVLPAPAVPPAARRTGAAAGTARAARRRGVGRGIAGSGCRTGGRRGISAAATSAAGAAIGTGRVSRSAVAPDAAIAAGRRGRVRRVGRGGGGGHVLPVATRAAIDAGIARRAVRTIGAVGARLRVGRGQRLSGHRASSRRQSASTRAFAPEDRRIGSTWPSRILIRT